MTAAKRWTARILLVLIIISCAGTLAETDPDGDPSCSVCVVGDLMCLDAQMKAAEQQDGSFDFSAPFSLVRDELRSADLTVGNLETVFAQDRPYSGQLTGFNAPVAYLDALKDCGFDVLVTANNHCLDMGTEGVISTAEAVRDAGIAQVGTNVSPEEKDRCVILNANGIRIAILSYTMLVNRIAAARYDETARWCVHFLDARKHFEKARLQEAVRAAREAGADVVMVYLHCGTEYRKEPVKSQIEMAECAAAAGADIVIESHTHTLQRTEIRSVSVDGKEKEVFCAYGMGNFMSSFRREDGRQGMILRLRLTLNRTDGTLGIKPSYIATYTDQWHENGIRFCRIVPLRPATEDPDSTMTEAGRAALERNLRMIEKRIGPDAVSVGTFRNDEDTLRP